MKKLTVRFSDSEHEELTQRSLEIERSLNEIIREAVREYLSKSPPTRSAQATQTKG
jgi:predicted HicB family RNase H-like nuclease